MTSLLTVSTKGHAHIRVHADAVLYSPPTGYGYQGYTARYTVPAEIMAMSLIGPEQSVRAIAAGSSFEEEHQRTELTFRGPNTTIKGRWCGRWNCRAQTLPSGVMHLVAMPAVTVARDVVGEVARHVIIPSSKGKEPTMGELARSIYMRLLVAYTTPILPLGVVGQCEEERLAAKQWCAKIVSQILASTQPWWHNLSSHPDQLDCTWNRSGLLTITQDQLDRLVCAMILKQEITLPAAA